MCGPPALAIAAAVVTAAGTMYGGLQANAQGKYGARVAERNARMASEQAHDASERGALEARRLDREYAQIGGAQRAAMAANGVDLGFGSALQLQEDTAMFHAEDKDALYRNVASEMKGFDISAANQRAEARMQRAKGKAALIGSAFSATGSLLSGASQYKSLSAQQGFGGGSNAYGISGSDGIY